MIAREESLSQVVPSGGEDLALQAIGLSKSFGGLNAVSNVDLSVTRDTLHSVIGPNGAGKTTLFNLLSGTLQPSSGRVMLEGTDVTSKRLRALVRMGMGRSFQTTSLFPQLDVFENVRLAAFAADRRPGVKRFTPASSIAADNDRVEDILQRIGLLSRAHVLVATLSHGDRRKVEIGLLIAQNARILLLDEPTAGLAAEEIPTLLDLIAGVRAEGKTVLLVEHNMKVVMSVSDRITVMSQGSILTEGTPQQVANDARVQDIYLGKSAGEIL